MEYCICIMVRPIQILVRQSKAVLNICCGRVDFSVLGIAQLRAWETLTTAPSHALETHMTGVIIHKSMIHNLATMYWFLYMRCSFFEKQFLDISLSDKLHRFPTILILVPSTCYHLCSLPKHQVDVEHMAYWHHSMLYTFGWRIKAIHYRIIGSYRDKLSTNDTVDGIRNRSSTASAPFVIVRHQLIREACRAAPKAQNK